MPKIFLKPNSAEFAENRKNDKEKDGTQECDMPFCDETGEYKAPKDRGLQDYYWFCLEHVRDYNRAWDFFSGMSSKEVEEHMINSIYGDRPTRRYDLHAGMEDILKNKAWQAYHFTEQESSKENNGRAYGWQTENRNTPEYEAMAIMGLEPPVTLEEVKKTYKKLAKKHHPDSNRGCKKSEELLKGINMAYTVLKLAYAKFEELPERQ